MVLGKNYRLSIKRNIVTSPTTGHRIDKVSFLLEHRNNKETSLLFESGTITTLTNDEVESIKNCPVPSGTSSTGFKMCNEAYGVLGILSINANFSSSSSFNTFANISHTAQPSGHIDTLPPIQYLVLVTGIVSVGKILDQEIFRITDAGFISLRGIPSDGDKIKEIRNIVISGTFYFSIPLSMTSSIASKGGESSIPFDITLCCQKMVKICNDKMSSTNITSDQSMITDNRFFWNRSLYLPFIRSNIDTSKWLIKTMCGSVVMSTIYIGAKQVKAALISRLSVERTGTRFNVRGVNDDGSVANFVETEQLINYDNYVSSYVMIRGSVPLFWSQPGVNVGSHKVKMTRGSEITQPCYDKHVASLVKRYGSQHFITLCGHKEGEANLTRMYRAHHKIFISKFDHIPLTIFDYHANCPKGKEDNLTIKLLVEIGDNLKHFQYFSASYGDANSKTSDNVIEIMNTQVGVFRVNCIDCLDRTNRVQTFIGLNLIESQLQSINLLSTESTNPVANDKDVKTLAKFRQVFESLWPSNGDQVSRIYSGTGALEGKSKLKDSTLSVARTIQNNLLDSSKQEAIDVLLFGKQLSANYIEKCRNLLTINQISHLSPGILIAMCNRYKEYTEQTSIKVVVSTYNVAGGKNFMYKTSIPLSDWLIDYKSKGVGIMRSASGKMIKTDGVKNNIPNIMDMSLNDENALASDNDHPDIYAIGFEEIVDLNAGNIVAASTSNQREWLIEIQKIISSKTPYVLVTSVQLVGVCLYIFIRPQHAKYIRDVSTDTVKTGLGGAAGNKGGVGVKFTFHGTSLYFICSHFAAGQSAVSERNSDYNEITKKLAFPSLTCGELSSLNCLDYIFWCGDFNYRINLDNETVRGMLSNHGDANAGADLETLKSHDQLNMSKNDGKCFHDYIEGDIQFYPTYKYDTNSDDYDTSEKQRVPAWTDRILYKKNPDIGGRDEDMDAKYGRLNFYGRSELKTSDHRPVIAEYMCDIIKVDPDRRQQVLFDCIKRFGPPDATILISVYESDGRNATDPDELTDAFVHDLIDFLSSSNIASDTASDNNKLDVSTYRKIDQTNIISATLKSGKMALSAIDILNESIYDGKCIKISLASPDYVNITLNQLQDLDNNLIPLTDAIDIDVDKIEQEADIDLGPVVDPRIFCVPDIDIDTDGSGDHSGRSSPSFFDKSPSDFDRTPISSCHTSPKHAPSRPAPPPSRPAPPMPSTGSNVSKPIPSRAAPPPPVKAKIVHQQALNPPTIMKTAPSSDSASSMDRSSFEDGTPPSSAKGRGSDPLKTKPPPIPKSPDPVKEAVSIWDKPSEPSKPAPPHAPAPPVPKVASSSNEPIKVTSNKPGFKDLFASDSIDDPFADDPFGGEDPFLSSGVMSMDDSFNVSAPNEPPPPPPTGFDTSDEWTGESDHELNDTGPPPPSALPPPPPVPSSPAPGLPNGPSNRGPPPIIPSRSNVPPPIVPPRKGV